MIALTININQESDEVIVVDLGSNSFHMLLATIDNGNIKPITTRCYRVQLGLGLRDNLLCRHAIQRALDCLQEIAPYTRDRNSSTVRIVGTYALRHALNSGEFVVQAEKILKQPIEIISGLEEAALVYRAVAAVESYPASSNVDKKEARLVVDIGGGSTEFIVGLGAKINKLVSVPVGCVSYLDYFPNEKISEQYFNDAYSAAFQHFSSVAQQFDGQWHYSIGCSGTLLAVEQVLNGSLSEPEGYIYRSALKQLQSILLRFDTLSCVNFKGLSESRRSVFASGLAIVMALFDSFCIDSMNLSDVGLREGLVWQLRQANEHFES